MCKFIHNASIIYYGWFPPLNVSTLSVAYLKSSESHIFKSGWCDYASVDNDSEVGCVKFTDEVKANKGIPRIKNTILREKFLHVF